MCIYKNNTKSCFVRYICTNLQYLETGEQCTFVVWTLGRSHLSQQQGRRIQFHNFNALQTLEMLLKRALQLLIKACLKGWVLLYRILAFIKEIAFTIDNAHISLQSIFLDLANCLWIPSSLIYQSCKSHHHLPRGWMTLLVYLSFVVQKHINLMKKVCRKLND